MRAGIPMPDNESLLNLVRQHLGDHQHLALQDVYKLLYQGVFGAEHLLKDIKQAKVFLNKEWHRVVADKNESLLEAVSSDGEIVRANIGRCKAEGISVKALWQAFYQSARRVRADRTDFERIWLQFTALCASGELPYDAEIAAQFGKACSAAGWPAKHHSAAYRAANKPAYRVVLRSEFCKYVAQNSEENV